MKWVKRMAGIIAGILIFSIAVRVLNYMYVACDDEWERMLWHSFYEDKGKIDNLYLGSSHVYCDINPYKLDQLNGQYNFNLSTSAQRMNGTYYLLKEADRCNNLSHVYVELYFYYMVSEKNNLDGDIDPIESGVSFNWKNTDYMHFSLNKLQYMTTMTDVEKYPDVFLGFSRYRSHLDDWKYVETLVERKINSEDKKYQYHYEWEDGTGYDEYQPRGRWYSSRVCPGEERIYGQDRSLVEDPMAESSKGYLRKVVSYCQAREIPITLFISPVYELQLISAEHYDNYLNQVREIAEEYDVDIYDFNLARGEYFPIQDIKYFRDVGHLNSAGADLYTEFFYKIMSGDATENQMYFFDTYEQKLAHAEPEVYGIYYRDEALEEEGDSLHRNMFIASNRDEGMEYKIVMIPEDDREQYILQDFSENKTFLVDNDEHGTCMITYRMKAVPDTVQTIEITY